MNVFCATANLGKDAEQRFTPNGNSVVQFAAAFKSGYGKNELTTWINCSIWGKRGESLLPYLKKGVQIAVNGELANRPWTDKEGNEKHSLELRVNDLTLIGGRSEASNRTHAQSQPESNEQKTGNFDDFSDDIPF